MKAMQGVGGNCHEFFFYFRCQQKRKRIIQPNASQNTVVIPVVLDYYEKIVKYREHGLRVKVTVLKSRSFRDQKNKPHCLSVWGLRIFFVHAKSHLSMTVVADVATKHAQIL